MANQEARYDEILTFVNAGKLRRFGER